MSLLKETMEDDIEHLQISRDEDSKIGHKTADSSFLCYKTHIAMSEERIMTGAIITSGEKNDGKQLEALIEKSTKSGIKIETVIGDIVYSEKKKINLNLTKMLECMYASRVTWLYGKAVLVKEEFQITRKIRTILI